MKGNKFIFLDKEPSGKEEEEKLFEIPLADPTGVIPIGERETQQNMDERIKFSKRAFCLVYKWTCFIFTLTFVEMICSFWNKGLSNTEFVAIVTSTTTTVFGLPFFVGRYLFPDNSKKKTK